MPWDIRWRPDGDIDFAPNLDLAPIGGAELIQQRMMVRLRMMRGWIYDTTGELGSRLGVALGESVSHGLDSIPPLVLEALDPMSNEISVEDILVKPSKRDSRSMEVIIQYRLITGVQTTPSPLSLTFPLP